MNRILDRKLANTEFDLARAALKAVNTIQVEAQCNGSPIDYAEIAERCAQLLCIVSSYNTLLITRAELGEG